MSDNLEILLGFGAIIFLFFSGLGVFAFLCNSSIELGWPREKVEPESKPVDSPEANAEVSGGAKLETETKDGEPKPFAAPSCWPIL